MKGLNKLSADEKCIQQDLESRWEVLAEAIQTTMRRYGINESYEQLKELTRGKTIDAKVIKAFVEGLGSVDEIIGKINEKLDRLDLGFVGSVERALIEYRLAALAGGTLTPQLTEAYLKAG